MQLVKTVRKAKNVTFDMIIGIDEHRKDIGKTRVWRKVQYAILDKVRKEKVFAVRNSSGRMEFLHRDLNSIVPVKVHPNTKLHKASK